MRIPYVQLYVSFVVVVTVVVVVEDEKRDESEWESREMNSVWILMWPHLTGPARGPPSPLAPPFAAFFYYYCCFSLCKGWYLCILQCILRLFLSSITFPLYIFLFEGELSCCVWGKWGVKNESPKKMYAWALNQWNYSGRALRTMVDACLS